MSLLDADRSPEDAAALHAGLAHPVRVAAMRVLRAKKRLPIAELRRDVAALAKELDARSMQHHVYKMQLAGLVDVSLVEGREVVALVMDVSLRVRPAG